MPLYTGNLMSGWSNKRKSVKNRPLTMTTRPQTKTIIKEVVVLDNNTKDIVDSSKVVSDIAKKAQPRYAQTKVVKKTKKTSNIPTEYEDSFLSKLRRMGL